MPSNTKKLKEDAGRKPAPQHFSEKVDDYEVQQGEDGAMFVRSKVVDVTFQDGATAAGNGTPFAVGGTKTITLEISGANTSRTVVFEGASAAGLYYPVMGVKVADFSLGTQTSGTGEIWQFDVTGLISFRVRIAAVAGGNVSVKGRAVA